MEQVKRTLLKFIRLRRWVSVMAIYPGGQAALYLLEEEGAVAIGPNRPGADQVVSLPW